jgi:hypothetical protein
LKIEIKSKKVAKVYLEMFADVEVDLDGQPLINKVERRGDR